MKIEGLYTLKTFAQMGLHSQRIFCFRQNIILSEYDEVDEEVIYSQESPNIEEFYRDFDWELDRFVEYRLPIKKPL